MRPSAVSTDAVPAGRNRTSRVYPIGSREIMCTYSELYPSACRLRWRLMVRVLHEIVNKHRVAYLLTGEYLTTRKCENVIPRFEELVCKQLPANKRRVAVDH